VWILVLLATVSGAAAAQTPPGFISKPVAVGQTVIVIDRNGAEIKGRVVDRSADALVLEIGGTRRTIEFASIVRIERTDRLWNGMLISGAAGGLMGAALGGASCGTRCARDVTAGALVVGAAGAGIGALADLVIRGRRVVYGPELESAALARRDPPLASLADLGLRVRHGDTLVLHLSDGRQIVGKFQRVTGETVELNVGGQAVAMPFGDIERVDRRGRAYAKGAMIGATTYVGVAVVGSAVNGDVEEVGGAVFGIGMMGAATGAAIGALFDRHVTVYGGAATPTVQIAPLVAPRTRGLRVILRF
jgi:hypothetical protein